MITRILSTLALGAVLASCALRGPPLGPRASTPENPPASGSAPPGQGAPGAPAGRPNAPVPRQFHLGPASSALVTQAHTQAGGGDYGQAAATLERALRIEPDNPLLWIELGRVRLGENNATQAEALGRKALALAVGDGAAQAAGWQLIADSLRARGRNGEAAEAEQHAGSLAAH